MKSAQEVKIVVKTPTEMLEEEHRAIQKVVGAMAVLAEEIETGKNVEAETLQKIVEFMRTFADKCHHGKEETHLFPLLVKKGVPVRGCPMGILTAEHQRGRALVSQLAASVESSAKGEPSSRESLLQTLRGLRALYPDHIWKEDYLLFPMTNKILSPAEQQELHDKFEVVEKSLGGGVHQQFEQLAEELEKRTQGL